MSQPHIVILGGAYAGLSALNNLISLSAGPPAPPSPGEGRPGPPGGGPPGGRPGPPPFDYSSVIARPLRTRPRYTLVDERDGFYHAVGAPLGQISKHFAKEFWVDYQDILSTRGKGEDISFVQGSVSGVDLAGKTVSVTPHGKEKSKEIGYDALVVATGMRRGGPVVPQEMHFDEYMRGVERFEDELAGYKKIVLVGGGAVGIEMAAEMKVHFPETEVVLVHSRDRLLSNEPLVEEFKDIALKVIREEGVDVRLGQRVVEDTASGSGRELKLSNGEVLQCDKVIYTATQQGANSGFLPKEILDDKGCVKAQDTLQFPASTPNFYAHYAIGDIVSGNFIKRSGPANMMGEVAATNIIASLLASEDARSVDSSALRTFPVNSSKATMSLAIGSQAIGMRMGIRYGKEVKQRAFGRALGIDGTLKRLKIDSFAEREGRKAEQAANM